MKIKNSSFSKDLLAGCALLASCVILLVLVACTSATSGTTNAETKSENTDLATLTLSSGTLSPQFAAATTSYTATVANPVDSVTVTGTASDSKATVSAPVSVTTLAAGVAKSATITVTAESGATKTYTVSVTRNMLRPLGKWTKGTYGLQFKTDNTYTLTNYSDVISTGTYAIAGATISLLDTGETETGVYTFSSNATEAGFTLVSDTDTGRINLLSGTPWGATGITLSGTVSIPASVTDAKWYVGLDTNTDGGDGMTSIAKGIVSGTSFSYMMYNVAAGTYYLYTVIDADHTWTTSDDGPVATGDYWTYYGGSPGASPNFNVLSSGSATGNLTTTLY